MTQDPLTQLHICFLFCFNFESTITHLGDGKTRKGLGLKPQETDEAGLLWISRNVTGKKWAQAELLLAHWWVRENGASSTGVGVSLGHAAADHCSLGHKSHGNPYNLGEEKFTWREDLSGIPWGGCTHTWVFARAFSQILTISLSKSLSLALCEQVHPYY